MLILKQVVRSSKEQKDKTLSLCRAALHASLHQSSMEVADTGPVEMDQELMDFEHRFGVEKTCSHRISFALSLHPL